MTSSEPLLNYLQADGFARFKIPERIELFEQLPRNAPGRVQRFVPPDIVTASKKENRS